MSVFTMAAFSRRTRDEGAVALDIASGLRGAAIGGDDMAALDRHVARRERRLLAIAAGLGAAHISADDERLRREEEIDGRRL